MNKLITPLLFSAFILILLMNLAQATDESSELHIDEEAFLFSDIPSVFSASKYEQQVTEAPARISIITSDEIQRHGHRLNENIYDSVVADRDFQIDLDLIERVALIWNPLETASIKLLYGSAFPTNCIFTMAMRPKSPPGLDPETIDSSELIMKQQLNYDLIIIAWVY